MGLQFQGFGPEDQTTWCEGREFENSQQKLFPSMDQRVSQEVCQWLLQPKDCHRLRWHTATAGVWWTSFKWQLSVDKEKITKQIMNQENVQNQTEGWDMHASRWHKWNDATRESLLHPYTMLRSDEKSKLIHLGRSTASWLHHCYMNDDKSIKKMTEFKYVWYSKILL